ncbi:MAG: hypothetical protein A3J50_03695 [Candidatus Woykebacteria bacterium RIFCSPHIGHO2_02_FULL_43_16b]|uniref:Uncharacterized protein n=1 Tax=Candidatus Woykebacteria bacterium RIFCSPHIGHO2_02_FULL_43_16b TaxID=1802601 RepID=A0A1G1WN55_9BACT|nr:MAG: hypothetical protein A3J50_03695 [Candidatus Woykebacteria bacterium RIFCSPHIGHO2_02_FULL_43_16b]
MVNRLLTGFFSGIISGLASIGRFLERFSYALLHGLINVLENLGRALRNLSRAMANYLFDLMIAGGRFSWALGKVGLFFIPTVVFLGIGSGWILLGIGWALFIVAIGIANYRPQKPSKSFVDQPLHAYLISLFISFFLWGFLFIFAGAEAGQAAFGASVFVVAQGILTPLIGGGSEKLGPTYYGPSAGKLTLQANQVATRSSGVYLADLEVSATFTNPQVGLGKGWDYGFCFRDTGPNAEYRVWVAYSGHWYLGFMEEVNSKRQFVCLANGVIANLDVSNGGSNTVRLLVSDKIGFLWVNGVAVTDLDLSRKTTHGDVCLASGIDLENAVEGVVVTYKDFRVAPLEVLGTQKPRP